MIDLVFGRRLTFHSPLTSEDLAARLGREVAPPTLFPRSKGPQAFEGTVADGRFRMMRSVRGRNSFRSLISGTVSPGGRGARVDVRLQLHPAVLIFCALFLLVAAAIASIAIPEFLATGSSPGLIFVIAVTLVFVLFAIVATVEARKATRMLAALFESQPADPSPSGG